MKILITGTDGNVGHYLSKHFSDNHEIFGAKKNSLDITNRVQCTDIIKKLKPDVVIHSAALSNIDLCERDETSAYTVNTIGSLNVAYACSIANIPIIYISCNNVYDGSKTSPYYETDECIPINIYGKTKLAGEKLIRTICSKYFIIRTSWVYGGRNCFVQNIIENKDIPIFMSSSDIATPTYIKDLSLVIEKMIDSDVYGTYNVVNSGAVKKSLWVKTILDYIGIKKDVIEIPDNFISNKALRPKCTILNTSLMSNCFDIELPPWEVSLKEYLCK
ncbi:putative dTDP-4-dehydrorhamnose reductase [Clostridiales bacterium oral taxon 876 str. F0540]|nr:putative dTDP-4-dehydrorhamnose reductase [Clostridiales bacterium oral taxon 876 str. F0540]